MHAIAHIQKNSPAALFQGRLTISPSEAAYAVFGWTDNTVRSKLCRNEFPIPLVLLGGKRLVRVKDLIDFVESQPVLGAEPKRKRGRPTKAEQLSREGK